MPKQQVKRKSDVITPTDLAQSDDEEPPQLTAQQLAKKAFRESLAEPVPPQDVVQPGVYVNVHKLSILHVDGASNMLISIGKQLRHVDVGL